MEVFVCGPLTHTELNRSFNSRIFGKGANVKKQFHIFEVKHVSSCFITLKFQGLHADFLIVFYE